jgi:large subunit ribosomal protein L25
VKVTRKGERRSKEGIMDKVVLNAVTRTVTGKQVGVLRREGKLPAVMYGHHFDSTPITLDMREATKLLNSVTSSSIVTISLDGKEHATLVREKQKDYLRNSLKHVDFQVVSLTEKIRTNVAVELVGIAPAVKDFNGVLVTGLSEIEVECFPQDLPDRYVIDLVNLAKIGDAIYVKDVVISEKVTILDDPQELIVHITHPVVDEVVVEEVVAGLEEPEVIEKGKKEEELPEEENK